MLSCWRGVCKRFSGSGLWFNQGSGFYVYGVFVQKEKRERLSEVAIVGAGGALQHLFLFCSPVGSMALLEQVQRAQPELTEQPEIMSLTSLNQSSIATDLRRPHTLTTHSH